MDINNVNENKEEHKEDPVPPRPIQLYQNGKIYKIVNINDPDEFYIGSSKNELRMRWAQHKHKAIRPECADRLLYKRMHEIGFNSFHIVLVELWPCDTKAELFRREDHWITTLRPTLNKARAYVGLTAQEYGKQYYTENRERIDEVKKAYYERTKDQAAEQQKKYYEENKQRIKEVKKKYSAAHKEENAARNKARYQNNIAEIKAYKARTYNCVVCNKQVTVTHKSRHEQSEYHKSRVPPAAAPEPIPVIAPPEPVVIAPPAPKLPEFGPLEKNMVRCDICSCVITKFHLNRHNNTGKHKANMKLI